MTIAIRHVWLRMQRDCAGETGSLAGMVLLLRVLELVLQRLRFGVAIVGR
jgi:hypothetical protein